MNKFASIAKDTIESLFIKQGDDCTMDIPNWDKREIGELISVENACQKLRRNLVRVAARLSDRDGSKEQKHLNSMINKFSFNNKESDILNLILVQFIDGEGVFASVLKTSKKDFTIEMFHDSVRAAIAFMEEEGVSRNNLLSELPHIDELFRLSYYLACSGAYSPLDILGMDVAKCPYNAQVNAFHAARGASTTMIGFLNGLQAAVETGIKNIQDFGEEVTIEDVKKNIVGIAVEKSK